MARLSDIPIIFRTVGIWKFSKRIIQEITEDNLFVWAAAMAYSWLFAIFPFLLLLLTLVPYLPMHARQSANHAISNAVTQWLGKAAPTINDNLYNLLHRPRKGWLGISLALSLWVASGGMAMTMSALDQCHDVKKGRAWYFQRLVAMLITICVTTLLLAVLVLLPIGYAAQHVVAHFDLRIGTYSLLSLPIVIAFNLARYLLAIMLILALLSIIYHFCPTIRRSYRFVTPGSVFSLMVWLLLDFAFRVYIGRFAQYDQTYGTVGGAAILLLFFYIIAVVLLAGAEIDREIDDSLAVMPPLSEPKSAKKADLPG